MTEQRQALGASVFNLLRLDGRVAVVVGGARDLGLDMAAALAEAGCQIAVTSRDGDSASASARRLAEAYGVEAIGLPLDHRDAGAVAGAFEHAEQWKGRIDVVINNAGGGSGVTPAHLLKRNPADVAELIHVNLTGALHCCQEAARRMVPRGRGKIINVASVAGLLGRDRRVYERNGMNGQPVDYAAAKAGVIGMTRDLAGLLGPHGICVNCISPGGFQRAGMPDGFVRDYADRTPLGRMGRDGIDLKGAALFLAGDASDYVTGLNLVVDGGFSLWR